MKNLPPLDSGIEEEVEDYQDSKNDPKLSGAIPEVQVNSTGQLGLNTHNSKLSMTEKYNQSLIIKEEEQNK
jgi:Cu/Zn superoxide dismutase